MKKTLAVLTTVCAMALFSIASLAADTTIEGTVSGYTCVVLGKTCPVDMEDPIIAAEKLFVIVKADGSYYLVPNLDRAILARHLTEKVRVTGALNDKYRSMNAKTLDTYGTAKGTWKTVWSLAMEEEARRMLDTGN